MTVLPLSSMQRRMWFVTQHDGAAGTYVTAHALRLRGRVNAGLLRTALSRVVAVHPLLRTAIELVDGQPVQRVLPPDDPRVCSLRLAISDLRSLSAVDRMAEAERLAADEVRRDFDLSAAPLLRASLVRLSDADQLLLLPIHHIVADGLSLRVVSRDLLTEYADLVAGRPRALPRPRGSYAEFIAEELTDVAKTAHRADLAWWLEHLAGKPPVLTIPTDHPRSPVPTYRGLLAERQMPPRLADDLAEFARQCRVTPFTVYCAAIHVLLARYAGQQDITLAFPFGSRMRREHAEVVGLYINTLLLRIDQSDGLTGRELVARVRQEMVDAIGHHRLQFEHLVEALGLSRSVDHHPVFQVLVGYIGEQPPLPTVGDLCAEQFVVDNGSARFDLEFNLRHAGGGLVSGLRVREDLFLRETADRMLHHLERLLSALIAESGRPVSELPMLDPAEERDAVSAGSGSVGYDDGVTVPDLIVAAARCNPDHPAVAFEGQQVSYGELDRRSALVARRLQRLGVTVDGVVGVLADRSAALVVALLGILRAGAAYLPLDPSYPAPRLADMVADGRPDVILTDGPRRDLPAGRAPVHDLTAITADGELVPDEQVRALPGSLAYVIFTSGSTGRPKGVMIDHRALSNRLRWMQETYRLDHTDAVLQKTPLSFDVSVWELFWPLTVGARLVVAKPDGHRDPDYLNALIRDERITIIHFVPSMLRAFLYADGMAGTDSLRCVICSGEALSPELRDATLAATTARLSNLYGPTEAAIDVTAYDCRAGRDSATVPIGWPINGLTVHVLGPRGEVVPVGVVGELHIGGIGLARGYANQAALTAQRFVPDPYGPPGSRLYRTGDLARRRPDGAIDYMGRKDDQVKLRGFRIELGEVESVIERINGVRDCVVSLRTIATGTAGLVAYLVVADGFDQDDVVARARAGVAVALPTQMMPTAWVRLTELPMLRSGKVDRGRLPDPSADAPVPHASDAGPQRARTPTEQALETAWGRVLGSRPASLDEDFFLAGGDSIRSIELVVASRALGLPLTVDTIFRYPSVRALAAAVEAAEATAGMKPPLEPFALISDDCRKTLRGQAGIEDAYPASTLLTGLVFESQTNPVYRIYTTALRMRGELDEPALRRATAILLRRHPFLRTSVSFTSGSEPLQLVHESVPDPVTVVDVRHLAPEDRERTVDTWFDSQCDMRFDWSRPPLLALTAHRLTDNTFHLTFAEPFLDGWSVTLALNELLRLYLAILDGAEPASDPVTVQGEFISREQASLANADDCCHWLAVLTDPPLAQLPRRTSDEAGYVQYERRQATITPATSDRLRQLADDLGVPVKSVLLAAHVQVVAVLTGRGEVLTGLMANSRPETAAGLNAIGLFLNTNPLRVRVNTGTRRDLVRAVHAAEATSLRHRAYPYAQMLRDAQLTTPFETIFNYTHFRPYKDFIGDGPLRLLGIRATDQTYYPLTAQFRRDVGTGDVALTVEFSGTELADAQRTAVVGYYEAALRGLADRPDEPVAPLHRLLLDAVSEVVPEPQPPSPATDLVTIFRRQAAATPHAVAFRFGSDLRATTYAQLCGMAAAMSRRLEAHGVGTGDRVAVFMDRTPAYPAAVLATLSRGAAYVPLDPGHPRERLAAILAASGSAVVVTTAELVNSLPGGITTMVVGATDVDRTFRPLAVPAAATAVLVFTSGSTGRPKGVVLSHAAVVNRLRWSWATEPADGDTFLLRTPIGFVDAVAELFEGLLQGAPTVLADDHTMAPDRLVDVVAAGGVTRITTVPTLLAEVLHLDRDLGADLRRVRHWHVSGEPLSTTLARTFRDRLPHATLHNLYGSTEVCADATAHLVTSDLGRTVPIGAPISGAEVYVLHEDGGLTAPGVPGELAVGGAVLADGYLDDARLTAQRFVPSPFRRGRRLYRTGDLAIRYPDGHLDLLGRIDRQLSVRGVRIEPAEVEAALTEHPGIVEAVVVQRFVDGRPVLVGYLRTELDEHALSDTLRSYLRERLPAAAIPDRYVVMDNWPRLQSGKLNMRALPDPVPVAKTVPARRPNTLIERELAALWADRLPTAPAGLDDDFFDAGGHSLHAIVLAAAIGRRLGVPVSVADVFDNPTLGAQAALVERLLLAELTDTDVAAGSVEP